PIYTEFRRWGKIQDLLELRHVVDLATALQDIDALLRRQHWIAVEVGRALFELGKVLHGFQRTLRAEETLHVDSAQRRRLDAVAELLWTGVASEVRRTVRVSVGVAIEAGDAEARAYRSAVLCGVILLLWKRRYQEAQPLHLLRIEDATEDLIEVLASDELPLGDVSEIGTCGEVDRWRELGKEAIGD